MSLSIGIVGLPNVGKSTLFNALLKKQAALSANYPFATIDPNIGVVDVPDARLDELYQVALNDISPQEKEKPTFTPPKIIPTFIKFYDIAGLVKGAHEGEGLGNQFLSHIREVDAILQVVRGFTDENVVRAGSTEPQKDIELINAELALADLQTIEKRLGSKEARAHLPLLNRLKEQLEKGGLVNELDFTDEEKAYVKELSLLTQKPVLYVLNVDEDDLASTSDNKELLKISAKVESELISFDEEERVAYLKELGIKEPGLNVIIRACYKLLGLQTFLTEGPKEVRAWTVKVGAKAPQAAGVIHTDFERGFIKADIIACDTLVEIGSWKKAKDLGKIRQEGKEYVMQDGDVVEFRFNV
jgi:GTP-binding protein YchF